MSQDPYEELLRQEQELMRRTGCWFRLFEGVAGLTMVLYALAALLLVVPLFICCGMFAWDVATK